mgnify:CR=1 FL=1
MLEKLITIQSNLKAPKGNYNSFGKYKYRSCEDILESVKPLLKEQKCALNLTDEIVLVGERYYVKATATFYDCESKESISVNAFARESKDKKEQDPSQITGTASSYARKYALNGLFCIDDTKDADTDEYAKQTKPAKKTAKELSEQKPDDVIPQSGADYLHGLAEETGSDTTALLSYYKVNDFDELTTKQFEHCAKILEKRLKEQGK